MSKYTLYSLIHKLMCEGRNRLVHGFNLTDSPHTWLYCRVILNNVDCRWNILHLQQSLQKGAKPIYGRKPIPISIWNMTTVFHTIEKNYNQQPPPRVNFFSWNVSSQCDHVIWNILEEHLNFCPQHHHLLHHSKWLSKLLQVMLENHNHWRAINIVAKGTKWWGNCNEERQ